jgi:hypothetical protein
MQLVLVHVHASCVHVCVIRSLLPVYIGLFCIYSRSLLPGYKVSFACILGQVALAQVSLKVVVSNVVVVS